MNDRTTEPCGQTDTGTPLSPALSTGPEMSGEQVPLPGRRSRVILLMGVLMAGILCLILIQLKTTLELVRETRTEKNRSMLTLLSRQIGQIARYGPLAEERLRDAFEELLSIPDLQCIALSDEKGTVLLQAGRCPVQSEQLRQTPASEKSLTEQHLSGGRVLATMPLNIPYASPVSEAPIREEGFFSAPGGIPVQSASRLIQGSLLLHLVVNISRDGRIARGALYPSGLLALTLMLLFLTFLWLSRIQRIGLKAEQTLSLTRQRNRHLRAVQMMAAGVAHEIKNPLGTIRGFTQLTQKEFPEGSKQRRYMDVMLTELDRVNERVARLLHFARPRVLKKQSTELAPLIQHVLELLEPDLQTRQISCSLEMAPKIPPVTVDPDQFQELLVNLVLNALEASKPGQGIDIRCTLPAEAPGTLRMEVLDRGAGMDEETRHLAFEPYYTTKDNGSGLGLPNCLRIVEAHRGRLWMEAGADGGTRVVADLPLSEAP